MTEVRDETAVERTVANGKRTGQADEQTRDAVLGASDTAEEGMRRAHNVTIDAFKRWNDRVAGTPITLLSGDAGSVLSGRAWVDGAFEVTETLIAAQRLYLDQFLTNQRQLVGSLLDSNFTLTKAMWHVTRGTTNSGQG
jgi:hypothetical protein